ncbi:putative quinol monooxygenase [Caulobacter sp. DWR1-3-2b1]|uniref:putative quinol monooxygenase n=1 Tax=Caulobacter sp. DWR1-3-2b1 TaxID=2804670 RepID=UPI003CE9A189
MTNHIILMTLRLAPDRMADFQSMMELEAPMTRAFEGCDLFEIYATGVVGEVLFLEHWRSEEHSRRYNQWRLDRGDMDRLGSFFTASPTTITMERIAPKQ